MTHPTPEASAMLAEELEKRLDVNSVDTPWMCLYRNQWQTIIAALRAPAQQEAVAWMYTEGNYFGVGFGKERPTRDQDKDRPWIPLFAHPSPERWIAVEKEMPPENTLVMVYSPPKDGEDARYDFDATEDGTWIAHDDNYPHAYAVAPRDIPCVMPSLKAPYTHWQHISPPSGGQS